MEKTSFTFSQEGNVIKAKGSLDAEGSAQLTAYLKNAAAGAVMAVLDFQEVTYISFAALRSLLRARQDGLQFFIINAQDSVAVRFEDSGVSSFINICRKPKALDRSRYTFFGRSFLSQAFNSDDGDSMIKIYGERVPAWLVAQEKAVARAVTVFGLPTPLVGSLYREGCESALEFERIEGKKSFSRIMADEPDRLEEMSLRFARMCKKLHSTPCDTDIFPARINFYRQALSQCKDISESVRKNATAFLDSIPESTTCLHGDMQMSNVITSPAGDMWIDLSDFGYGYPMLDLGMLYFQARLNKEEIMQNLFHFGQETMDKFWPVFIREYFGVSTPEEIAEADRSIVPYAALHMIYLGATYGFESWMFDFIEKVF